MAEFKIETATRLTKYFAEQLKNTDYWINSGNLLGIHRDGDFIAHDTDIDFGCALNIKDRAKFQDLPFEIHRPWNWHGIPMQRCYLIENHFVDFYYFWAGLEDGVLINVNDHGIWRLKTEIVLPTQEIEWKDFKVKAPADIESYLTWHYGDWKTPKQSKQPWYMDAKNLQSYSTINF